ncbi:MAG: glycoside hydrolase family 1 protein [Alphaproteobacteria bacterium]|nr:glycoside hydrolase family 1 protein [Alphaproteobacteria bacterium]MCB9792279.1 glycoside hydrolase family 1 protein [Alphaproteobacteria bacterium]
MLILALLACSPDPEVRPFPEGFHFGAATAGFQVDAGCPTLPAEDCEDRASDWYQFVTDPELIEVGSLHLSGDPMSLAPGHWELWAQDLDRAAGELGHTAYRFSFEWSRLFPDGAAEQAETVEALYAHVDAEALNWYHEYLNGMAARGLTPVATINHYTLPLWVHDGKACRADIEGCAASGWVDGDRIIPLITLYAGFLAREFGPDVTWWLTLNEPIAVILPGYLFQTEDRTNPPGVQDVGLALQVAWNMAVAHNEMAQAVRAEDGDAQVGVVANLGLAEPMEPEDPEDVEGAAHLDYVYNQLVLDAFVNARMDWDLDGEIDEERPELAGRTDFLGLNYYFAFKVSGFASPLPGFGDYPYLDFYPAELDPDPAYIGQALDMTAEWGLPIWITENGVADPGPEDGADFLLPSLEQVQARAAEGMDIRGYLYWSLVDNYEWNHGMGMRFGLYAVDDVTKERTLRPIGEAYRDIVAAGGLPLTEE